MLSGLEWGKLLIRIQQVSSTFSIVINVFLIHLILNKSPKQIGVYKFLMLYFALFEIFYGFVVAFTCPFHHTQYANYMTLVSTKDRELSPYTLNILNAVYWACYGISLAMFGIHFVYRYLVASGNRLAETFQSWKMLLWFSIPVISGGIWAFNGYVLCAPNKSETDFIKGSILITFGLKEDEFVYLGPRIFEVSENKTIVFNIKPSTGLGVNVLTVNLSFFTIFFFGIKCYRCIKTMVKQSASSNSGALQKQLFYALVVQTFIPVLLMQLPFTVALILCLFNINDDVVGGIVVMTIAVYPAIDPLPNIIIIKDYRRAVLGYLKMAKNRILCRRNYIQDVGRGSTYTDGQTFTSASHGPR